MLYEIVCDQYKSYEKPRGAIRFSNGLNIVKGEDAGDNSIGKSTILLAIDFAFGGSTYAQDKIMINEIGHHLVKFCFIFNEQEYYFSRNTETADLVNICDKSYQIKKTIPIGEYCDNLKTFYNISLPDISFREMISRYFRIYGKTNLNEKKPLASYNGEGNESCLLHFAKIYNVYSLLEKIHKDILENKNHIKAIKVADSYKVRQLISSSEYKDNLTKMQSLELKMAGLVNNGEQELLLQDSEKTEQAIEYKTRIKSLKRKRSELWSKYYSIKENSEQMRPATTQDFNDLLRFFPNSNIKLMSDIENFHTKLSSILVEEFTSSMKDLIQKIDRTSAEILELEKILKEYNLPQVISKKTLETFASLKKQFEEAKSENELFDLNKKITKDISKLKKEYEDVFVTECSKICDKLNNIMADYNSFVYGDDIVPPTLNITKSNSYSFSTSVDGGTGTNTKNLILFDLAMLKLSPIPAISHDTILFKNIGQYPMAKIFELYNDFNKQIFIAIDETNKYLETAQHIVNARKVLHLSLNGNELFGYSWNKKTKTEKK